MARRAEVAAADDRLLGASTTSTPRSPVGWRATRTPTPPKPTADWVRRWLSTDPDTVAQVTEALALSREAVTHGQYVPQFAEVRAFALGLEPPPQMLLFEWDILTGDSAVLDVLYAVTRDSAPEGSAVDGVTEAIDDGQHAIDVAMTMRDLVAGTDETTYRDPALREQLLASLTTRSTCTPCSAPTARWSCATRSGSTPARAATSGSPPASGSTRPRKQHEETYGDDLALPAYNLTAARIGEERAARDLPMAWLAGRPGGPAARGSA